MVAFLEAFKLEKTVLMVMGDNNVNVIRSARNIQTIETLPVEQLNTYDVVRNAVIVIAQSAIAKLEEVYGA